MSARTLGILEILLSGFFFGFLGLFGKRAFEKDITPGEFLAFRYLIASLMMGTIVITKERSIRALWLGPKTVALSLMLGIVGYAVFSGFYFLALERISASMTVILLYTYPVLVAAGGVIIFRDRIPLAKLPALPMAFGGLMCLVWTDFQVGQPIGLIFGLLAAFFYTIYILVSSKWLQNVNAMASTFWIQMGAGLVLFIGSFSSIDRTIGVLTRGWLEIVLIAFFCSVLAMWLFLSGLLKVKSWEASLLSMAEPITGVALGVLVLGDQMSPLQWTGAGLVLLSLALVSLPQRTDQGRIPFGQRLRARLKRREF